MELKSFKVIAVVVVSFVSLAFFNLLTERNVQSGDNKNIAAVVEHKPEQRIATLAPDELQTKPEDYEQLSAQLRDLVDQVGYLSNKVQTIENSASDADQTTNTEPNPEYQYDAAGREAREAQSDPIQEMAKQMRVIENTFFAQDYDPSWSHEAEARLQNAFSSQALTNHAIQSVECRTSLCRLEITSLNGELGGFHEGLRDQISDILPAGAMMPNGDSVTVFLAQDAELLTTEGHD